MWVCRQLHTASGAHFIWGFPASTRSMGRTSRPHQPVHLGSVLVEAVHEQRVVSPPNREAGRRSHAPELGLAASSAALEPAPRALVGKPIGVLGDVLKSNCPCLRVVEIALYTRVGVCMARELSQ